MKKLGLIPLVAICSMLLMGAVGDVFKSVMTDSAGNIVSTPLSLSNNITLNVTNTSPSHLAPFYAITNRGYVTITVTNGLWPTTVGTAYVDGATNATVIRATNLADSAAISLVGTATNAVRITATNQAYGAAVTLVGGATNQILTGINTYSGTTNTMTGVLIVTNLVVTAGSEIPMCHAMYSTTNTLTTSGGTVSNIIDWTDIAHTYNFTTTGGKVYAKMLGTFMINVSALFAATTTEDLQCCLWFRTNGVNLTSSATYVDFPTATVGAITNCSQVVSVPIIWNNATTNDYFEVLWWGQDNTIIMPHTAATTNSPARPACPAAIITVNKISGGTGN